MREIKFRVWDKLRKSFIYPDIGYQGHFILSLNGEFHNLHNGSGGDEYVLQQFTGLKDKNGKEIYEGDILSSLVDYSYLDKGIYKRYYIIEWSNGKTFGLNEDEYAIVITGFTARLIKSEREDETYELGKVSSIGNTFEFENFGCCGKQVNQMEIIGNIFENPELLK